MMIESLSSFFSQLTSNRLVNILIESFPKMLLPGLKMTIPLTAISFACALVIAVIAAMIRVAKVPVLQQIVRFYIWVIRGTPLLVQLYVVFYGLPNLGVVLEPFPTAVLVFSINEGAYCAETMRAAIESIPRGQMEAGVCVGMSWMQTMRHVVLPQAFRNIIPQIGNNFIINIKDTSVMFVIGFIEFFAVHRNIVGLNLMYFPSATIEMIGYLCLTLAASILLRVLEKKMDGNDSYELVQVDALTMSAGTYNHPSKGTPFDERNPEAVKSMLREDLRRQAERDAAIREGQKAETRRSHGERNHQDGGEQ